MTESERNLSHIQKAAQLVNAGNYERAEKLLKEMLGTPELAPNIKASALGLLGLIHKFGEKYLEAQDLLESGLALGRSQGWALEGIEGICADALGDVHMTAAHNMVNAGKMEEADKIVRKLRQIIITYSSQDGFRTVHHEGMTLWSEGMISAAKGSGGWANALDRFGQVVSSPYKEYFVSKNLKFVIGLAYANMGRINLAQGACEEATQYLEESLRYYDQDSEDAKKILQDVAKARSEKRRGPQKRVSSKNYLAKGGEIKKAKGKCSNCVYIEIYSDGLGVCRCKESPYYNQEVDIGDCCECFANNPAEDYFSKGLHDIMGDGEKEKAINNLEKALQLGLPLRDEVICRASLVEAYLAIEAENKSIKHFEKALALDVLNAKRFGERYVSPFISSVALRFSCFYRPGVVYVLRSREIKRKDGIGSAISYLREKLRLFDYLPGTYMSLVYLELGGFYIEKGQKDLAVIHFRKAAEADVYPEVSEGDNSYQESRNIAQNNLEVLAQESDVTTELNNRKKALKKDIERLSYSITEKLGTAGTMAYSLVINGEMRIEDKEVEEVIDQIKSIDNGITDISSQIQELKSHPPTEGFWSRLKDKVSSTAKIAKLEFSQRSMRKSRERAMLTLGEKLYSSYATGGGMPSKLQQTWEIVDKLKQQIKRKEAKHSHLEDTLKILDSYRNR